MLDSYYTPRDAAAKLVTQLGFVPYLVADFCVGGGELLRACTVNFPKAKYVAIDKSRKAIRTLHAMNKEWEVFCADFLDDKSMAQTGVEVNSFDLVVLNPPFTCRGTKYRITLDGQVFSGSKALLFLTRALSYVRNGGVLRAILPTGTICAERDAELVRYLRKNYKFKVYGRSSRISFGGKTPNVIFIDMRKALNMSVSKIMPMTATRKKFEPPEYLIRGCLNVVDANKIRKNVYEDGLLRYIHTTDLQSGRVQASDFWILRTGQRIVSGHSVLLPRVGTPSRDKICIVSKGNSYILSDCVMAVRCKSGRSSQELKRLILGQWNKYQQIYVGTGAQYTTLRRLNSFLSRIGWNN